MPLYVMYKGFFMRIGVGYDAHRLITGRDLIIGGCRIPFEMGLLGHSDADVLVHAVIDALLGAAGLGDIGRHFPDTDEKYKNFSSIALLEKVKRLIGKYKVINIDAVVIAEAPKLAEFLPQMKANVAQALDIPSDDVNIKATTEEGMGFTGKGEGIAAHAVVLIGDA